MKHAHSMMALALALTAFGCDATAPEPTSGMLVLDAQLDTRRADASSVALVAPLERVPNDPRGYPALLERARDQFGAAPGRVAVRTFSLVIDAQDQPNALDDVFAGDVEVRFQPEGGGASVLVATIPRSKIDGGGGTVVVTDAAFDTDLLADADRAAILAGGFDVQVSGPAAARFQQDRRPSQAYVMMVFDVYP